MQDEEIREKTQELVRQIQEKSIQLSDLEIILEDYSRERSDLLREIGRLKASLWELIGDAAVRPSPPAPKASPANESND